MKSEHDDLRARSLLAVFAHPDDESLACGGLLAWCAHLGARVSVCCATAGELGPGPADIRSVRLQELRNAAQILGVTDLVLLDHEDGMLPWTEAERLEADIRRTIGRLRPDVVITFGEDGLYGHPDHIAIHERTTAAVAALGADAPALYYVTMPSGSDATGRATCRGDLSRKRHTRRGPTQDLRHRGRRCVRRPCAAADARRRGRPVCRQKARRHQMSSDATRR